MNNNLPSGYQPLKKLTICSNTLTGGGNLVSIGNELPVVIGRGSTPQIWLKAIGDSTTNELVPIVEKNKSMHPAIKVTVNNNSVLVLISGEVILSVKATSQDVMIVDKLDLRPIGLNLYGDTSSLSVGGNTFSRNSMHGGGTLIGFGA
ncbi:hypothetical protein A3K86_16895 [Photobacterium jeanii]|uniref:Uncharacterized protein n=1 Tax=Photobacterium jeanii TaxID=858640 RepID=A0A178K7L0_9GAMM|nr:hypothetical protein [Photobacterium jeanii]OAN13329.1 hypothetical protein A3K86_16895 [Photobacterium jeanii]PST90328.1 hypothetical protein C9I91_06690 [Photobacterium jeanii]